MTLPKSINFLGAGALLATIILGGTLITSVRGESHDDEDNLNDPRVQKGLAIAPVHLNFAGKSRAQVGLGSYLVNAVGGCNDCHTNPPYAVGGDPYLGQPKKVNTAGYLAGGAAFGPFLSRNLTPDKTGKPEGGSTFGEFLSIMRTGVDPDHAHPQFGPFLQVMPWPTYQDMTTSDLQAIYTYLSAIPCVEGEPGLPNPRPIGTRCK